MVRSTFLAFWILILLDTDLFSQRKFEGFKLDEPGGDTLSGEFNRPSNDSNAEVASYAILNLSGQQFEYLPFENDLILLQRLSGEVIRLYRNLDSNNPQFFIYNSDGLSLLTPDRINVELATHFSDCSALSNAMAYTRVKYKTAPLVELFNEYLNCRQEIAQNWSRPDSVEMNLAFNFLNGSSSVQDQPFKDHSGNFSNSNFQGWGFTLTAFSNRKIRLLSGLKVYDMSTTNAMANVTPFNNPEFVSQVQYRWTNYEVPFTAAYNFQLHNWRAYIGIGGSLMFTNNLLVSESFDAPFLNEPQRADAQLVVNQHFGVGGMVGVERKIGRKWLIGIQYEIQRSQMDFNLVRINRNLEEQPPILATYEISTPALFASATDLTKLMFTTNRVSFSIKFRGFWKYRTFN